MKGRAIRVGAFRGELKQAVYVVAESDRQKAMTIVRNGVGDIYNEFEDLGPVSEALLDALKLMPGQFAKT